MSFAVVTLVICSIVAYTGQGFFNKLFSVSHPSDPAAAAPAFNVIYGATVAIVTFCYNGLRLHPDVLTLCIGIANGAALFFYNHSAIHAARTGPYALQSMITSFGTIIPSLVVAVVIWGDAPGILAWLGIACMLAAFVLCNLTGLREKTLNRKGLFWLLMVFLTNGVYSILTDAQTRLESGAHRNDMIVVTYLTAALISFAYLLVFCSAESRRAFSMPARPFVFSLVSSLCAAVAVNMLMLTLRYVPSSILYPVESGGILILSAVLSRIVLKERLNPLQIAGISVAVVGLVLTNL